MLLIEPLEPRTLLSFITAPIYAAGSNPRSVAVGDFNGDGVPDLAVAGGSGVSILLGQGDGTFQVGQSVPVGGDPYAVVAGDFTGRGTLDLAVADISSSDVSGQSYRIVTAPTAHPTAPRCHGKRPGQRTAASPPKIMTAR